MAFKVNSVVQTACEDLMLTSDGDPVSGELASQCEGALNRAINSLNSDGYISLTVDTRDVVSSGSVVFRKLEEGEQAGNNVVDMEPPDTVSGVSRKVGVRYMRLRPSNPQQMDRTATYSYPTAWSYGVSTETAPSGEPRNVGTLRLNGTYPAELRIYLNSQMPNYRLGDTIYLSPLYYNLVLYALEAKLVDKYKLFSYQASVDKELAGAMRAIDNNTARNRPLDNGISEGGSYLDGYYQILGGNGF